MDMRHRCFRLWLLFCCAAAAAMGLSAQTRGDVAPTESERSNVSDAQLGLEVQVRLFDALGVSNLSTLVRNGVATLDGMVNTEEDRARAEELALGIEGVSRVVNKLRVATATTVAIAEQAAAIANRERENVQSTVTTQLRSDPALAQHTITVEANDLTNTVTLTGVVATEEEKQRASELASAAFPAGQIRNRLEVRQRL
jgi:osmotically-inducible protein OsmY